VAYRALTPTMAMEGAAMSLPTVLPRDWKVPDAIKERLGEEAGRQRIMQADGHLLLIVHAVPGTAKGKREGRLFWRSADGFWRASTGGQGIPAIRKLLDEYAAAVQAQEQEIERADEAEDYFRVLRALTPQLRSIRHLHQTVQQAREAVSDDRELILLRDAAGNVERAAELVHSDAQFGLDFTVAKRSEDTARAQHRLNLLVAFFFPAMTAAALLGMDVPSGLHQLPQPWTYWTLVGGTLVLGLIVRAAVLAPRKAPGDAAHPPGRFRSRRPAGPGSAT
jgi:hypothetical protein